MCDKFLAATTRQKRFLVQLERREQSRVASPDARAVAEPRLKVITKRPVFLTIGTRETAQYLADHRLSRLCVSRGS